MLRRIPSWQFDHDNGVVFANAFDNDDEDGEPTDRHSVNWKENSSVEETMEGHWDRFGLAAILAEKYTEKGQEIIHTPQKDNYGHCDAKGEKKRSVKNHLRKNAVIIIEPPRPS